MKWTARSILFPSLLVLTLCLSIVCAEAADSQKSILDMIPGESLAYISISDLDVVVDSVTKAPEWQELLSIPDMAEQVDNAKQGLSLVPMLFGISIDEFLSSFGHSMAACVMGLEGQMPIAGLIVDAGEHKDQVSYSVDQIASFPAMAGGAAVEESEYRGIPCTIAGNSELQVKYGLLDNFLMAGVGGGFERLVDFYKDGGESIKDTPNFQLMEQKVSLSGNLCFYVDLERALPLVKLMTGMETGEGDPAAMSPAMLMDLASDSVKSIALSLDLLGHTNEVYLNLKQKESHPITDLVLAPRSPMYAANLLPLDDGVMVGVHIGDPTELLDRGLKLAELFGIGIEEIEDQIQQMEEMVELNLRDDLLSALTGEIAVIAMLPREQISASDNVLQMAMQVSKVRPIILVGVKDAEKLEQTFGKLAKLASVEGMSLKEESYKGVTIYTKALPLDVLMPGIALMPAYSFKDNLLIMSNSSEWVRDAIDLVELPGNPEIQNKLSESRILLYVDAAGIADFAMEQNIVEDIKPSEPIQDKLKSLGSVAASFALGPEGAGIRLISTSDDDWATKILRGVMIAVYVDIEKASKREEALEKAAWEAEPEWEETAPEETEKGSLEDDYH